MLRAEVCNKSGSPNEIQRKITSAKYYIRFTTPLFYTGRSCSQVALRWLLQKDVVPAVVTGVTSSKQLHDNIGAVGWHLTEQQVMCIVIPNDPPPRDSVGYMTLAKNVVA